MILGTGTLASALRYHHPNTTFLWIAYDTPILPTGHPDIDTLLHTLARDIPTAPTRIAISSQIPVGTTNLLAAQYPQHTWAHIPENIRAAHAIDDWADQPRIIIGTHDEPFYNTLYDLLYTCAPLFIHTDPTTAEFSKHALNAYLALTVTYANQIADLGEQLGVNIDTVATALKSDPRIGWKAYVNPDGLPGPHLLRDVNVLRDYKAMPILDGI